jgi:hypothetical protein
MKKAAELAEIERKRKMREEAELAAKRASELATK